MNLLQIKNNIKIKRVPKSEVLTLTKPNFRIITAHIGAPWVTLIFW